MTTLYERELQDKEMARLFAQEQLIEEAGELIAVTMEREGVSRAELARRIGTSKAHVTQLLAGSRNMTLRTFADVMHAMGCRVVVTSASHAKTRHEGAVWSVIKAPRPPAPHKWKEQDVASGRCTELVSMAC